MFWILFVMVPSFPSIRKILAAPLVVTDAMANGEVAYVLSGGSSFKERLSAAADLYHMGRVSRLMFIRDEHRGAYNFVTQSNWSQTQWALDFLKWLGVPPEKVLVLEMNEQGVFGTLSEARFIAEILPKDVERLVLVTSAAHTRRSMLAFRRALPKDVTIVPYAATKYAHSMELYMPLWLEYFKLLVYAIVA
ncbi:MAG: YdcF family protein [bacterium]